MRLTIIKNDNTVYIDGVPKYVDCSSLPADFHALQWEGESGLVEFVKNYKSAEEITDLTPYQSFIDEWHSIIE